MVMSELVGKLSSYNIINYIIPGGVFCYFIRMFEPGLIKDDNLFLLVFFVYFVGMTISRIGSVVVEPLLKKTGFVKFESYNMYLSACKKDKKIDVLLESASLYRTVFTAFFLLSVFLILKGEFETKSILLAILRYPVWMSISISFLFLFSYRKQIGYVRKRILYCDERADDN